MFWDSKDGHIVAALCAYVGMAISLIHVRQRHAVAAGRLQLQCSPAACMQMLRCCLLPLVGAPAALIASLPYAAHACCRSSSTCGIILSQCSRCGKHPLAGWA